METKIDILNRDEFINRVIQLVNLISSNKGNTTFAIKGTWGCGKTFVLEEIERRLSEDSSKKYLVIHYNCWQYDYYEEPLVALVSALLDFLKKTKKVSPKRKEKIVALAKQLGKAAFTVGAHIVEYKMGLDFEKEAEAAKDIIDGFDEVTSINEKSFDSYFDLKDTLEKLKKELAKLSNDKTIVFCVDELDRCLPEYAIKVLERLHHLTEELPNTITIIAVDKARLENTVHSIFGKDSATDYLKKFIRFELTLDNGQKDTQKFFDKFSDFYSRFDSSLYTSLNKKIGSQFLNELFGRIDSRAIEQIVEKATIINDVCFGEKKQDHTMMYMELFMATLYYYYHDESIFSSNKVINDLSNVFSNYNTIPDAFRAKSSGFNFEHAPLAHSFYGLSFWVDLTNIYMIVYCYWYYAVPLKKDILREKEFRPSTEKPNELINNNIEKIQQVVNMLKIIA